MKIDIRDNIEPILALELVKRVVRHGKVSQGEKGNHWLLIESANYSIGELIEILPTYCWYKYGDKALRAQLKIFFALGRWHIAYRKFEDDHVGHLYGTQGDKLIDALYDMAVKLKEEGVI